MLDAIDMIRDIDHDPSIYNRDVAEAITRLETYLMDATILGDNIAVFTTQRGQRGYHIASIIVYRPKARFIFDAGFSMPPIRMERNMDISTMIDMVRRFIDDYGYTFGMVP